ncbi:MAG: hypothetical protein WAV41_00125 [Microgenomates group bacterium]
MNKYIVLLIVLAIGVGYFMSKNTFKGQTDIKTPPTIEQQLGLPNGWTKVETSDTDLKLEKKVEASLQPQIVFKQIVSDEATSPAKYTNTIIAGARSAIPSLKITDDKRSSTDTLYTALITGSYLNRGQKVNILQRVYIKSNNVFVMTASYNGDLSDEINKIFDSLVKEKSL